MHPMCYLDWGSMRVLNCRKTTWRPWLLRWPLVRTLTWILRGISLRNVQLRAMWNLTRMGFSKGGRRILSLPSSMHTRQGDLLSRIQPCY